MTKKIVAIGGGRYCNGEIQNVIDYIVNFSGKKNPSVVYLPTAGHDDISDNGDIQANFEKSGISSYTILLLTDETLTREYIKDTILGADIIYVGGGNVQFMMDTWKKTGADKFLVEAYEKGIVMSGYSAGADCWFRESYDDCGENGAFVFVDCLDILPYCACPHFESGHWQDFKDEIKTRPVSGVAMENGAALVIEDGKYSVICGNEGGNVWFFDKEKGFEGRIIG